MNTGGCYHGNLANRHQAETVNVHRMEMSFIWATQHVALCIWWLTKGPPLSKIAVVFRRLRTPHTVCTGSTVNTLSSGEIIAKQIVADGYKVTLKQGTSEAEVFIDRKSVV